MMQFSTLVRIPGYPGATTSITTDVAGHAWASNSQTVDTIFFYEDCFVVDGKFWIPKTAGALVGWEY